MYTTITATKADDRGKRHNLHIDLLSYVPDLCGENALALITQSKTYISLLNIAIAANTEARVKNAE